MPWYSYSWCFIFFRATVVIFESYIGKTFIFLYVFSAKNRHLDTRNKMFVWVKLTFLFHASFSTKASQIENASFLPKTDVFGLKGKFPTQKQTFLETFALSPKTQNNLRRGQFWNIKTILSWATCSLLVLFSWQKMVQTVRFCIWKLMFHGTGPLSLTFGLANPQHCSSVKGN